jgi:hypothetical protein
MTRALPYPQYVDKYPADRCRIDRGAQSAGFDAAVITGNRIACPFDFELVNDRGPRILRVAKA